MKKLKLKALTLGATEILTREQLKTIMGGCSSSTDCGGGNWCDGGTCKPYPGSGGNPGTGSGSGSGIGPGSTCGQDQYWCSYTSGCVFLGYSCPLF